MSTTLEESNSPPETANTSEQNDDKEKEKEKEKEENNKEKDYILLREDFPNYDFSFKVIVIGNSGN